MLSQRRASLLKRLTVRRQRERERLVLVEGVRTLSEALRAGADVRFALVSGRLRSTDLGRNLEARLLTGGFDVTMIDDEELAKVSSAESSQGVLAVCEQSQTTLGQVVSATCPILILDALQDPGNVGTLIRSAVAFGFNGIIALDGTADPWGAKVVRASAGAAFRASIALASAADAAQALTDADRTVVVAASEGKNVLKRTDDIALVVGNEGAGVREGLRQRADATICVPVEGPVESLNAGIAGSILMHQITRERKGPH